MVARAVLYLGFVLLGFGLLLDQPVPLLISP